MSEVKTTKLNFEPYKEPLKKVEGGFGYVGTIGRTPDGNLIQCHICGGLYANLGTHANKKHGLKAKEYRQRFQIAKLTPLISANLREQHIATANAAPAALKQLRLQALQDGRDKVVHPSWKWSLETNNIRGTCPDQLIEKIQALTTLQERVPTLEEFRKHYKGLAGPIYRTFGSWNTAVRVAGLDVRPSGRRAYYTKEILVEMLRGFTERQGRRPVSSDLNRDLPTQYTLHKYFGSFTKALEAAGISDD